MLLFILFITGCEHKGKKEEPKINIPEEIIVQEVPDYTYDKMKEHIKKLKRNFNQLNVSTIGKSHANRNIYLIKLGSGNKKIAVVGGVHGRESITSLLVLRLLEDYARHLMAGQKIEQYNLENIFKEATFYFIPMLNPDGIEIAINGLEDIDNKEFYFKANEGKKYFSRWKANSKGVDLNKQFKAHWKEADSSTEPHYSAYKGPSPESEPESKALADLTRSEKFSAVVCFHHSGEVIYWYYNQQGEEYSRDLRLAKIISNINGYKVVEPEESEKRAAGYKDWFVKKFQRPGFTIEIGKEVSEKPLPSNQLNIYFEENRGVLLELAENI